MTRSEAIREAAAKLRQAGVDEPEPDARLLARAAFGVDFAALLASGHEPVGPSEQARLEAMLARRAAGEPTDRILGVREFWGMPFRLTPETLSPRPDTETVVAAALKAVAQRAGPLEILDLGVGSGCLLLALLSERPDARGVGVDRSPGAAAAARANAASLGFGDRARFIVGDWASALEGRFDLIVSNPPYIPRPDLSGLATEVAAHDPLLALDGGEDGLAAYAAILRTAPRLLTAGGVLAMELGVGQRDDVVRLAQEAGFVTLGVEEDLAGIPRALVLGRP